MKQLVVTVVLVIVAAFQAYAQKPTPASPEAPRVAVSKPAAEADDPEPAPPIGRELQRALTPSEKERILRSGVLTLFGPRLMWLTPVERQQLAEDVRASTATYLRWLGYFWTGVPTVASGGSDYQGRWTTYLDSFKDIATRIHALSPATYTEFVIPELVTEEVGEIDMTTPANKEIAAFVLQKTGVVLPARFEFAKIRQDRPQYTVNPLPDYVWSCHYFKAQGGCTAGVYVKNGIPSINKPQGKAWALYLAARAIRADADAIYVVPSRDLATTRAWQDLTDLVNKIRAMKPNVIIGSQDVNRFPTPPAGIVPRNYIDFIKTMADIDVYTTDAQGRRTVAPSHLDTGRVPCYILGDAANALYLPGNSPDANLCIVNNRIGRRPPMASQTDNAGRNIIEANFHSLPLLLEYDPTQTDCGPIYLPNPDPRLTSPCNRNIRHGLSVPMIFPTSTPAVRHRYIHYSYRFGLLLTRARPFPVYVFGWLNYGEGVFIRQAWEKARTDDRYVKQKSLIRMSPDGPTGTGVLEADGLPPARYLARQATGDLAVLKAAIRSVVPMP